jgi:hypothetical protein
MPVPAFETEQLNPVLHLSEKDGIFSDMKATLAQAILTRMQSTPAQVFSSADFAKLGTRDAIDQALSRLTLKGTLRRLGRGFYDKPRSHPKFGLLLPSADALAKALADKGHLKLQPSGAYAANLLGLTDQVPMKLVFLTNGASRTVKIGGQEIVLKHTTPRNMATAGRVSGTIIQALRHWKRSNVDKALLAQLRRRLSAKDKAVLQADAHLAPAWIANAMLELATGT